MEDKYKETLEKIANYVLPVYTINGTKYVKVENARAIREWAKEALKK